MLSTGADCAEIKINEIMQKFLFFSFYFTFPLRLESETMPIHKRGNLLSTTDTEYFHLHFFNQSEDIFTQFSMPYFIFQID